MLTTLTRIVKFGWQGFLRNSGFSVGTTFVTFIALFLITSIFVIQGVGKNLVSSLESKVDISVYFNVEATDANIAFVQKVINDYPGVAHVEYISRDQALANFKETHKDDANLMEALNELDSNPLPASLNIQATQTEDYANIASFLGKNDFKNIIDKVNYSQNEQVIQRLASVTQAIQVGGMAISIILALIAFAVTYNTIRISIFAQREEIEIMRLVGAGNPLIRGPYIFQGVLVGILASVLSLGLLYGFAYAFSASMPQFFQELQITDFVKQNLLIIFSLDLLCGMLLGGLSSFFAAEKHLTY